MKGIVDVKTKKITGCEEYSLAWFHERGHIEYNESHLGNRNILIQEYILQSCIFSICIALIFPVWFFKFYPLFAFLVYLLFSFYEEAWCWRYARKEYDKFQKGYV